MEEIDVAECLKYVDGMLRKKSELDQDDPTRIVCSLNVLLQENRNAYNALAQESDEGSKEATLILTIVHHFQRIGFSCLNFDECKNLKDSYFVQKFKIDIKCLNKLKKLLNDEEKKLCERFFDEQFKRQLLFFTREGRDIRKYIFCMNDISYYSNKEDEKYFLKSRKEILENFNDKKNIQLWWLEALEAFENKNYQKMSSYLENIVKKESKIYLLPKLCMGILNAELIDKNLLKRLKKYIEEKIEQSDYSKENSYFARCLSLSLQFSSMGLEELKLVKQYAEYAKKVLEHAERDPRISFKVVVLKNI